MTPQLFTVNDPTRCWVLQNSNRSKKRKLWNVERFLQQPRSAHSWQARWRGLLKRRVPEPGGSASYHTADIDVAGDKIFCRRYGQGPPGPHGSRRSHDEPDVAFLASEVGANQTVVCVDLRA